MLVACSQICLQSRKDGLRATEREAPLALWLSVKVDVFDSLNKIGDWKRCAHVCLFW